MKNKKNINSCLHGMDFYLQKELFFVVVYRMSVCLPLVERRLNDLVARMGSTWSESGEVNSANIPDNLSFLDFDDKTAIRGSPILEYL